MIRTDASTTINRSIDDVFRYVTDPSNEPAWHTDVASAALQTPLPIGVGSETAYSFSATGGGGKAIRRGVAFEPNALETIQFSRGPMGLTPTITLRFAQVADAVRFTREVELEPGGIAALLAPLISRLVSRRNATFVENLRRRLENP